MIQKITLFVIVSCIMLTLTPVSVYAAPSDFDTYAGSISADGFGDNPIRGGKHDANYWYVINDSGDNPKLRAYYRENNTLASLSNMNDLTGPRGFDYNNGDYYLFGYNGTNFVLHRYPTKELNNANKEVLYTDLDFDPGSPGGFHVGNDGNYYIYNASGYITIFDENANVVDSFQPANAEDTRFAGLYQKPNGEWFLADNDGTLQEYNSEWGFVRSITLSDTSIATSLGANATHFFVFDASDNRMDLYSGDLENPFVGSQKLTLEADRWQAFNSTQKYEVTLKNDSGVYDVTTTANLTSSETSVIAINNSTDSLQSFGNTGVSQITANYDGLQSNATNVTVGNRNLSNIGIMPPSQYINSFLGIDETAGDHGIGSGTQWLIFVIIVAATFGRAFDNDWAGLGLGLLSAIMLWVLEFIGLGMILSITFFVIFVGTLKLRVRNRGSNGGDISVNVESRDFNR